jgi:ornithine carbamoyltransferase
MKRRHFLALTDLSAREFERLLERAIELKAMRRRAQPHTPFTNKVIALVFEKSSTRTRVSFEAAMAECGGHSIFLSPRDAQLGRGETIEDTARVLSRMCNAIVVRTFEHEKIETMAAYSDVPVINGLTDRFHPCQLVADMQTYYEHRGAIKGRRVVWLGDGCNTCNSYIQAAGLLGFSLRIACPPGYEPQLDLIDGADVEIVRDPLEAARDAALVVTDVWTSMGQEQEREARHQALAPFQVNTALMARAAPDALFMHCLPAHRGEEVSAEVIDGPQSVVWDEAENRLHAQKALLELLLLDE